MGDPTPDAGHALFPGTFDPVTLGHLDLGGKFFSLTVLSQF